MAAFEVNSNDSSTKSKLLADIGWLFDSIAFEKEDGEIVATQLSVDTFAKILYLKGQAEDLRRLKVILILFFTFEQISRGYDPRYTHFFASLLKKTVNQLQKAVRIISLNYDSQFEISYQNYTNDMSIKANRDALGIVTKNVFRRINSTSAETRMPTDRFSIYKINGTCSFYHSRLGSEEIPLETKLTLKENLINWYSGSMKKDGFLEPATSFAWEDEEQSVNGTTLEQTLEAVAGSEILVIIGYSIPYFNRDVDQRILGSLANLNKIYIQDKDPEEVKARLAELLPNVEQIAIGLKSNIDQFFLPTELRNDYL